MGFETLGYVKILAHRQIGRLMPFTKAPTFDTEANMVAPQRPDPVEHLHDTYGNIIRQLTHEKAGLLAALESNTARLEHLGRQCAKLSEAYDKLLSQFEPAPVSQPEPEDEHIAAARKESEVLNHG